ncbi:hypothetical protein KDA_28210 [Dictyobacter alpinus]|uniref:Uncharacterized protein n=1 Tax=Dictyobacter alpinus TaxID=2014873 RepID=A0A402B7P2_9CHLR|nr:hypothetical protein [Dictyobacter alpinus]GCE27337.1 hypothetical protein KDA_28210 [Dictyobacter alpinus]
MSAKDDKMKKVEVEPISGKEKQAEKKELMEAAKKARADTKVKDELDDVETISKEQAQKEIQQAAQKVKNAGKHK